MDRVVTKHKRAVKKLAVWDGNGRRGAEYDDSTDTDLYRINNSLGYEHLGQKD